MDMDETLRKVFDVIVLGTGTTECMIAAYVTGSWRTDVTAWPNTVVVWPSDTVGLVCVLIAVPVHVMASPSYTWIGYGSLLRTRFFELSWRWRDWVCLLCVCGTERLLRH